MSSLSVYKKHVISLTLLMIVTACGGGSSSSDENVQPSTPVDTNAAPIIQLSYQASVQQHSSTDIDANQSSDPDGDAITFSWSLLSAPDENTFAITNTELSNFTFTPNATGDYQFELAVSDGDLLTTQAFTVEVTNTNTSNEQPIADAGSDQTVNVEDNVLLSAANSADPNGDSLTFTWSITSKPSGSQTVIPSDTQNALDIEITPDTSGSYVLSLLVSDGELDDSDTVTIDAQANNLDITDRVLVKRATSCADYQGTYSSNVNDIKRGMNFVGSVSIDVGTTECNLTINQIPNHNFNDQSASFATNVSEVHDSFQVVIDAAFSGDDEPLSLGTTEAVMLNGVTLDMLAAACYDVGNEPLGQEKIGCGPDQNDNPWRYDPMSPLNTFGTDSHNAHTQPNGKYHYHANPVALFSQSCTDDIESPVIGFAADGFPIYGSCIKDPGTGEIRKVTASYVLKDNGGLRQPVAGYTTPQAGVGVIASSNYDGQFRGDWEYQANSGDLDQCNGMTVNGHYGYYVTDSFPWVINCFKGQVHGSFSGGAQVERRSHSHDDGTTHSHE